MTCSLYSYRRISLANLGRKHHHFSLPLFYELNGSTDQFSTCYLLCFGLSTCRISRLPEDHYPYLKERIGRGTTYFSRDLPYSLDFLLENFMGKIMPVICCSPGILVIHHRMRLLAVACLSPLTNPLTFIHLRARPPPLPCPHRSCTHPLRPSLTARDQR